MNLNKLNKKGIPIASTKIKVDTDSNLTKKIDNVNKIIQKSNRKRTNHENQQRSGSLTDSEESESSLSSDSLNITANSRVSSWTSNPNLLSSSSKTLFLPHSLLKDIRERKNNFQDAKNFKDNVDNNSIVLNVEKPTGKFTTKTNLNYVNKNSVENLENKNQEYVTVKDIQNETQETSSVMPSSLSMELKKFLSEKISPFSYECDQFYNFHLNENTLINAATTPLLSSNSDADHLKCLRDESFAGYTDINCTASTIRSTKGTVRGVKNRVRNGIATFLQMQQPSLKNLKKKDIGKVIVYTTSMGIIRETYTRCANVKQILRTLLVKFEERDVFMSLEYQQEIKERMQMDVIEVPQLFVEGQYVGDADVVEKLNETGELRKLLKPYKSFDVTVTCKVCGGYRLLPCPYCNGSKKSLHRNHFTAEFIALKCMNCDEVGLVKCHNC
ncbi:glutaredoxin domain-containing cysteine-rich protein CG31559-like [Condylostylus longicornis]|uniref:glutaredoxin domain-containing cysteine-rich protein CG31559-like n=1 Tax=Condylostylus longicornis TaxID=2530218 RepID=UPI00244E3B38|nr:glutaredoxin domain-containing cysteine-rich protein CG31559-like [Condylostylus longicornis]